MDNVRFETRGSRRQITVEDEDSHMKSGNMSHNKDPNLRTSIVISTRVGSANRNFVDSMSGLLG